MVKEDKKIGIEYFNLADIDLEVAEILYREKKFSLAIFHLQQAVEKTVLQSRVSRGKREIIE